MSTARADAPVRGLSFDNMVVALLFVVVAFGACLTVAQAATFWNLRAGQEIWRTGHVPRIDTYSFTAAGQPWPDHEWLWQALAYPLFRLGGFPLLTAAAAVTIVAAVAVVYRLMQGPAATRFVFVALAIPLASLVWTLRPQLATLLALPVLLTLLVHDRTRWVPVLFLVWANTHGGVALGGLALGVAVVLALLRARRAAATPEDGARVSRLLVALPLSALACAATPLGFGIFRFVLASVARLRAAQIAEWRLLSLQPSLVVAFLFLVAGFMGIVIWRWRQLRREGTWADWICVALALAFLPFALRSARHIGLWLLLAPVAASRLLGPEFRWRRKPPAPSPDNRAVNAVIVALVGGAAAFCVAWAWARPLPRLGWQPVPPAALAALRACPGPLYNHYNEGGYLIWLLPERKVFIDDRQDPFDLSLILEHERIESGKASPLPLFARYGIRCSFLDTRSPTVALLEWEAWRTTYIDETWAVQVAP